MKKSVLAMALAAVVMLAGCSEENTSIPESQSDSVESTEGTNESLEGDIDSTIELENSDYSFSNGGFIPDETNNEVLSDKQKFINEIENEFLPLWDTYSQVSVNDKTNYYDAQYVCSLFGEYYAEEFIMFLTDDVTEICDKITSSVEVLVLVTQTDGDFYDLIIRDKHNTQIAIIGNWGVTQSSKNVPYIQWTTEMREKYKQIEDEEIFKDFEINVVN